MEGKICAVTGANAGLGYATTLSLAKKRAEVLMICRSKERGSIARRQIIEQTGNPAVHLILADFSSLDEVRQAGRYIRQHWERLDVLINNAAVILSERKLCKEGYEMQFTVNHLAPFLLTHTLMPAICRSEEGRIVNVSSNNHRRANIYFEDIHLNENYQVLRAYGQSKLANILFTYELDRRLKEEGIGHDNGA
jgi:NAD(P)-dependent dehydrogenase (short-subunit alcohol dehydrogenase family)